MGALITSYVTDPGGPGQGIGRNELLITAFAFTYASLLLSLAAYPITKYQLKIWHANALLVLYAAFIAVSIAFAILYGDGETS